MVRIFREKKFSTLRFFFVFFFQIIPSSLQLYTRIGYVTTKHAEISRIWFTKKQNGCNVWKKKKKCRHIWVGATVVCWESRLIRDVNGNINLCQTKRKNDSGQNPSGTRFDKLKSIIVLICE